MARPKGMKSKHGSSVALGANVAAPDGWPTLGEMALHGLPGELVRKVSPHSEADSAAILIQFLAAFGNMIGPGLHCRVESTRHPLILFPVLIGETAKARKGTSWGHIEQLLRRVDEQWSKGRVTTGLSSGEGLIWQVRDGANPPNDPRLLVVQGEFASVLRIMSRDGNTLSPIMRDAWDGRDLRTLVKNNPMQVAGPHISVIGHISREELLRYLSTTEAHNGFANRCLWVSVARSKCLPEGGIVPEAQSETLARQLRKVQEWAQEQGDSVLKRDDEARSLWAKEYFRLSEGLPGLLGAATARAEAQVLRLSAVYAVLDCSTVVRVEHLKAALAVWEYCFASAAYIFGKASGDPVSDRITAALLGAGPKGMSRTQIRDLFKRHESAERIERVLDQLAGNGLARTQKRPSGGRDMELWFATEAT